MGGFLGQRLDGDRRCVEIIEQRFQLPVKQRQPMLDAGGAAAFAHRFIEDVVGRGGAERRDIAGAKPPDRFRGELELGHRHEVELAQLFGGALGFRIEAADRFQRVAEEIEPHRVAHAGREQIDDAAADRVVAGLAHGRGAGKSVELEPFGDAGHRQQIAGRRRQRLPPERLTRRHALEDGVDGGEQNRRPLAAFDARQPRQRHHALRHHAGMRRNPVVGQAIPGRKFQHLDVGGEKRQRARQRRHARTVAADHREADRGGGRAGRDRARQIGEDKPLGAVGNAGKKERPAGRETLGRRSRRRSHMRRHRPSSARLRLFCKWNFCTWNSFSFASTAVS